MSVLSLISALQALRGKHKRAIWLAIAVPLVTAGCSGAVKAGTPQQENWLSSGSLALSRPVPVARTRAVETKTASAERPTSLDNHNVTTASVIISRNDKTLTAIRPGQPPLVLRTEGTQHLKRGSYSVTLKEDQPLWYAPTSYFTKRSLKVPAEGSRERFRRAALGSKTLFLNDQTPIHSGPVWIDEIGGLRINGDQMAQFFSTIEVGTRVEVR